MRGLKAAARTEHAVQLELAALALSIPAAFVLSDSLWVFVGLVGVVLFTLSVELLNTAIEKLCDYVCPQHDPMIGLVKDMGSAAILFALALAGVVWCAALSEAAVRWTSVV
jgi:diacylglycerol kinase (ATP)